MCRVIEEIRRQEREEAWQEALQVGRQEGREEVCLESIQSLMKNLGMSIVQAMDILEIPVGERMRYQSLLESNEKA